jgi:hypothetical protein
MICPFGYYYDPNFTNSSHKVTCVGAANVTYTNSNNKWSRTNDITCKWGEPTNDIDGNIICIYQYK